MSLNSTKYITALYTIGYITVIIGTILHILDINAAFYVFSIGTVLAVLGRALSLPHGDWSVRRLNMIQLLAALCLFASAYFIYVDSNSWAVTLLISAFIDLYTSFRYNNNNNFKNKTK